MTDEYRCDDYELHPEPVVTEGNPAPTGTDEYRSHDHDELMATSTSTVTEKASTKVVKSSDDDVETKGE